MVAGDEMIALSHQRTTLSLENPTDAWSPLPLHGEGVLSPSPCILASLIYISIARTLQPSFSPISNLSWLSHYPIYHQPSPTLWAKWSTTHVDHQHQPPSPTATATPMTPLQISKSSNTVLSNGISRSTIFAPISCLSVQPGEHCRARKSTVTN